jgi:hypothetical protein
MSIRYNSKLYSLEGKAYNLNAKALKVLIGHVLTHHELYKFAFIDDKLVIFVTLSPKLLINEI